MPFVTYPFQPREIDEQDRIDPLNSAFFNGLPNTVQELAANHVHLLQYLQMLPIDEIGAPGYAETLSRDDAGEDYPNIIYPTTKGLFTHILTDPERGRDFYIAIQPQFEHPDAMKINDDLEGLLLDYTEAFEGTEGGTNTFYFFLGRIFGGQRLSEFVN